MQATTSTGLSSSTYLQGRPHHTRAGHIPNQIMSAMTRVAIKCVCHDQSHRSQLCYTPAEIHEGSRACSSSPINPLCTVRRVIEWLGRILSLIPLINITTPTKGVLVAGTSSRSRIYINAAAHAAEVPATTQRCSPAALRSVSIKQVLEVLQHLAPIVTVPADERSMLSLMIDMTLTAEHTSACCTGSGSQLETMRTPAEHANTCSTEPGRGAERGKYPWP